MLSAPEQIIHLVEDNLRRRHLTPSQKAAIWTAPEVAAARAAIERAAQARQEKAGARGKEGGRGKKKNPGGNVASRVSPRAPQVRDDLGRVAGVSGRTIDDAKLGWDKAPEQMEAIRSGQSDETVSRIAGQRSG